MAYEEKLMSPDLSIASHAIYSGLNALCIVCFAMYVYRSLIIIAHSLAIASANVTMGTSGVSSFFLCSIASSWFMLQSMIH